MEVETESDGSLSLCNVAAQFPNASGLKYIGNTNFWRGVRRVEESFSHLRVLDGGILFMLWS